MMTDNCAFLFEILLGFLTPSINIPVLVSEALLFLRVQIFFVTYGLTF